MNFTFLGHLIEIQRYKITLDGSGDGTKAIVFEAKFTGTPSVTVIKHKGDSGSFSAASVTNSGCTLTAVSSDIISQDYDVLVIITEQL